MRIALLSTLKGSFDRPSKKHWRQGKISDLWTMKESLKRK